MFLFKKYKDSIERDFNNLKSRISLLERDNLELNRKIIDLNWHNHYMEKYLEVELKTTPKVVEFVKKTQV